MIGYIDPTKQAFAELRGNNREGPSTSSTSCGCASKQAIQMADKLPAPRLMPLTGRDSRPVFIRLGGGIIWQGGSN
jgi:hypothetical protein